MGKLSCFEQITLWIIVRQDKEVDEINLFILFQGILVFIPLLFSDTSFKNDANVTQPVFNI